MPLDMLQLLNELMHSPGNTPHRALPQLGKISPRLPSCRASFMKLITFLINVNHVRGGSQRGARRALPPLQSGFVLLRCPALQGHNSPIKAQQVPIKRCCPAEGGIQKSCFPSEQGRAALQPPPPLWGFASTALCLAGSSAAVVLEAADFWGGSKGEDEALMDIHG